MRVIRVDTMKHFSPRDHCLKRKHTNIPLDVDHTFLLEGPNIFPFVPIHNILIHASCVDQVESSIYNNIIKLDRTRLNIYKCYRLVNTGSTQSYLSSLARLMNSSCSQRRSSSSRTRNSCSHLICSCCLCFQTISCCLGFLDLSSSERRPWRPEALRLDLTSTLSFGSTFF